MAVAQGVTCFVTRLLDTTGLHRLIQGCRGLVICVLVLWRFLLLFLELHRLVFPLLLLMLDFELFIGLGRDFNLIAYTVINLWLALSSTSNYLVGKYGLIDDPIEGAGCAEILVIDVAIFRWEDSDEVASLYILLASLANKISLSHSDSFPHAFVDRGHVFLRVLSDVFLDHSQELLVCSLCSDLICTVSC